MTDEKKIVIIAGPNGAGKTTFATEFLPFEAGCPVFVNADLIADSHRDPRNGVFRRSQRKETGVSRCTLRLATLRFGGTSCPPCRTEIIRRRFVAGMRNFMELYRREVDYWQLFDNSSPAPQLLDEGGINR